MNSCVMSVVGSDAGLESTVMRIVSRKNLGEDGEEHRVYCTELQRNGYRFSKAMKNPGFISVDDIKNIIFADGIYKF